MNTLYIPYKVRDFTLSEKLTSYTFSQTPLYFVPSTGSLPPEIIPNQFLWDYGDGTQEFALTGTHSFIEPGRYEITLFVYDNDNNAYQSSYSQTITAFDYIENTIQFDNLSAFLQLGSSVYSQPLSVIQTFSAQYWNTLSAQSSTIFCHVSGAPNPSLFNPDIYNHPYRHLIPTHSFYLQGFDERIPTQTLSLCCAPLYGEISNNQVVRTALTSENSFVVGCSAIEKVYFKSSYKTPQLNLVFTPLFNTNSTSYVLSCSVAESTLSFTGTTPYGTKINSNGLWRPSNSTDFTIYPHKYVHSAISFVIGFRPLYVPTGLLLSGEIALNEKPLNYVTSFTSNTAINEILIQPIRYNDIEGIYEYDPSAVLTILNDLSGYQSAPVIMGKVTHNNSAVYAGLSCVISLSGNKSTAFSSAYSVYPLSGSYYLSKINEDIDFQETMKDLRFQEFLLEDPKLFDDFLGSAMGNNLSWYNAPGKKAYEKIQNFVGNTIDIDTCNVNAFYSIANSIGIEPTNYDKLNFAFPSDVRRMVDLGSISWRKLKGEQNKFNQDFNALGIGLSSNTYAINLGDEIDYETYTFNANEDNKIIAFEKFSGYNTLVSTNLLSAANVQYRTSYEVALSSYNETWGWGLVLPDGFSGIDIPDYYVFYNYRPNYPASTTAIINEDDILNTVEDTYDGNIDYSAWSAESGVLSQLILQTLNQNLSGF